MDLQNENIEEELDQETVISNNTLHQELQEENQHGGKSKPIRTFTVVGAYNSKGCPTKFKEHTRYTGRSPAAASKKAFTELCRVKDIKGVCTIYVKIQETTRNSKNKEYSYLLHRTKLSTPIVRFEGTDKEFKIKYSTYVKSSSIPEYKKKCKGKSSGPMKTKTAQNV
jgi:hypothetical protein